MQKEKAQRTITVEHRLCAPFAPDTAEFSLRIESSKVVGQDETVDQARLALTKIHAPKAFALTELAKSVELTPGTNAPKLIAAHTVFGKIEGETRSGTRVVEKFSAVTMARFKTTAFQHVPQMNSLSLQMGGSSVFDVCFILDDPSSAQFLLASMAAKQALMKASAMCNAIGARIGEAVSIENAHITVAEEQFAEQQQQRNKYTMRSESAAQRGQSETEMATTTIVPRDIELCASVRAVFLLRDA